MPDLYNYKAVINKVIDGDTVNLTIDLGFHVYHTSNCRLYGINTPELNAADPSVKTKALLAKNALMDLLPTGETVTITSKVLDKYGRPLVIIYSGLNIVNALMIEKGLAENYLAQPWPKISENYTPGGKHDHY
jgi:micrococcal nuclease